MTIPNPISISLITFLFLHLISAAYSIGVNYGTLGDNLPPPAAVADFIKTKTTIDRVKIFDTNPNIIQAFAHSGIPLVVTTLTGDVLKFGDPNFAHQWVVNNIKPFYPATNITCVLMGSEVLHWGDKETIRGLVPAMRSLHGALQAEGLLNIKVTTAHSLIIMRRTTPPSAGQFRPGFAKHVLGPMLKFLRETHAPFMFNPYPYFNHDPTNINFSLFRPSPGLFDPNTKLTYTNQFDTLVDAVHSAMKALDAGDVDIALGETGWPSACDNPAICSPDTAASYNGHLISHVESGRGTLLMPNRRFETYIFGLFNENQKPGPNAERSWGLFQPNFSPVYDCGIMRGGQGGGGGAQPVIPPGGGARPGAGEWCVPKPEASGDVLVGNIDYVCSHGVDCGPIQPGGVCYVPNDARALATYAMSAYYKAKGPNPGNCDFAGSGVLTHFNPSHGACIL